VNSRVVQIHGAREDTDRESMVRTFGYDTMKMLNKYWYEEAEDKVRLSDLEDKSADTHTKNIETIITMLRGIVPYAVIIDLSRSNVKMPVIRAVLRASELDSYGMIGVGRIYEWYRDGVIESDDEVAVTFHPETLQPLSVPLVNIRATLEYALDRDVIDPSQRDMLLKIARSMYYPDRSYHAMVKKGVEAGVVSVSVQDELIDFFVNNEVDVKQDDALLIIEKIRQLF
jgi:hypothetical protein